MPEKNEFFYLYIKLVSQWFQRKLAANYNKMANGNQGVPKNIKVIHSFCPAGISRPQVLKRVSCYL